jgi:hypothetical protein
MNSNLHAELEAQIERNEIRETYLAALVLELGEIAQAYREDIDSTCAQCGQHGSALDWPHRSGDVHVPVCRHCDAAWSRVDRDLPDEPAKYAREKLDASTEVTK